MKKLAIVLVLACLPLVGFAQMTFEHGDWASVKAKATRENKAIFIDFYTVWCGPCKVMAKNIFPLKDVGDFYNANFINYKIDAEKDEGVALAQKYGVKQFPTYIYTDASGDFLHQSLGSMPAEEFINAGKDALDPNKQLKNLAGNAKKEIVSKDKMPKHLRELSSKYLPYNDLFESYLKSLSKKELYTEEAFNLINELGGRDPKGYAYNLMLENKKAFSKAIGKDKINNYFYQKLISKAYRLSNDKKSYDSVLEGVNTMGFGFSEKIDETIKLTALLNPKKDYEGFAKNAQIYLQKYKEDASLKYSVVFNEGAKYFLRNETLEKYILKISDELIADNNNAFRIFQRLAYNFASAGYLEKAKAYYIKLAEIATTEKQDATMAQKSIDYLTEKIATQKSGIYTLNVEDFDNYNGKVFKIFTLSETKIGAHEETEGVEIKDGKVRVTGKISSAMPVVWAVYEGEDLINKGYFILEPGIQKFAKTTEGKFEIENSAYNHYLYYAWEKSKIFKDAKKKFDDFRATLSETELKAKKIQSQDFRIGIYSEKVKFNESMFNNHPNPTVKALLCYTGFMYHNKDKNDTKGSDRLALLKSKLGADNLLVKTMEYHIVRTAKRKKMAASISSGSGIKDFTAKDLKGKEVQLSKVLKKNKYVLLEFWASWCAPCRQAIPHLKELYAKYNKDGFEIVSFSIDHKRTMWEKASKVEKMPWISVSDLIGNKSPIALMYGVSAVPYSILVDGDGNIISSGLLSQKGLDEKLEELFK